MESGGKRAAKGSHGVVSKEKDGPLQFHSEDIIGGKLSEKQRTRFYKKMAHVIVKVEVYESEILKFDWEGAGVFISKEGHILTLSHIFCGKNESAKVKVTTKEELIYDAYVMSIDESLGLAILSVFESDAQFSYAKIAENVCLGEEVYPIGHPFFLGFSYPVGQVSFSCRTHGELCESVREEMLTKDMLNKRSEKSSDPSAKYICHVDNFEHLQTLSPSVSFVQVNNVHGDGMGGASGMTLFNCHGEIIGMYYVVAYDQCFGIHAKTLNHFLKSVFPDGLSQKKKKTWKHKGKTSTK